jgi:dTDP-glucose 4,6-dehydratase
VRAFHVGSGERLRNIDVARAICRLAGRPETLITLVTDRPGHDRRYALSSSRLRATGWQPTVRFAEGLGRTLDWYRDEAEQWREAAGAGFESYFARQYGARLADAER